MENLKTFDENEGRNNNQIFSNDSISIGEKILYDLLFTADESDPLDLKPGKICDFEILKNKNFNFYFYY
jgi:hypothetical protein